MIKLHFVLKKLCLKNAKVYTVLTLIIIIIVLYDTFINIIYDINKMDTSKVYIRFQRIVVH